MAKVYEHQYTPISVYGNVVSLLRDGGSSAGVHLDIGCGYGPIAEPIQDEFGLTYVGFDLAEDGLDSLRERGFEVHQIDLADAGRAEAIIRAAVGDRPIASVTFIDTLEHLTNGVDILAMLRRIADRHGALLVLSVPNVTHKDLALKLLIGRWDITEAGLLDHTHVASYNSVRLSRVMTSVGWCEVAARDWLLEHSDQQFPVMAPVLNHKVPLGKFLRNLINRANPHALVNQFVRMYRIDKPRELLLFEDRSEPARRLLTILVAVQEVQTQHLYDLLRSLAQQTNQDFKLLIITHPSKQVRKEVLEPILTRLPQSFLKRIVLIASAYEERALALNVGLTEVAGRYLIVLREGDIVEPNWCATFAELSGRAGGAVLRVGRAASEQSAANYNGSGDKSMFSVSHREFEPDYIFPLRLEDPPSVAEFAVPAEVFRDLGLRFDSEVSNCEVWDIIIQASLLCGVVMSPTVVVSHNADCHRTSSSDAQSDGNPRVSPGILAKLDAHPLLLPPGSAERILHVQADAAALRDENAKVYADLAALRDEHAKVYADLAALRDEHAKVYADLAALRDENAKVHADAEVLKAAYDDLSSRVLTIRKLLSQPLFRTFLTINAPKLADEIAPQNEVVADGHPFLSIITRTQGSRIQTLRDVLMCLAGQTCQDFELLIVVHSKTSSATDCVRALVAEFPAALQARIRIMACTRDGRGAPLNDAQRDAKGQYIAVLDDDDLVFSHWVEAFQTLAREAPGALLRTTCTRQDVELIKLNGLPGRPRSTSWFKMEWPATYDAVAHLYQNHTPFMSMAFPAALFHDLELRFNESLSTTEDWEFANRAAMLCGVVTSSDVTSIYRWWTNTESSSFLHAPKEWEDNRERILQKLNSQPILLPPGSVARINMLTGALNEVSASLRTSQGEWERHRAQLLERNEILERQLRLDASGQPAEVSRQILVDLVNSTSWRYTRPLRKFINNLRGQNGSGLTIDNIPSDTTQRLQLIGEVRTSSSWRLSRPLRIVGNIMRWLGIR